MSSQSGTESDEIEENEVKKETEQAANKLFSDEEVLDIEEAQDANAFKSL
jgi:hypothetical protein